MKKQITIWHNAKKKSYLALDEHGNLYLSKVIDNAIPIPPMKIPVKMRAGLKPVEAVVIRTVEIIEDAEDEKESS